MALWLRFRRDVYARHDKKTPDKPNTGQTMKRGEKRLIGLDCGRPGLAGA